MDSTTDVDTLAAAIIQLEIQNISLLKSNGILQVNELQKRLKNLQSENNKNNLYLTLKHFKQFKSENYSGSFYDWLQKNTNYITNLDLLIKIKDMFDLRLADKLDVFNNVQIINGPKLKEEIEEIMKEEDFIFLPK